MDASIQVWVNSDKQIADGLTKPQAAWKLLDTVFIGGVFPCSCVLCFCGCTRASPCLFWSFEHTHVSLPMFHLKVHCRKGPMQKRVNWKASRVMSRLGNLPLSRVADQVGNLEFSCCGPGWEPGALVVSTRWDLVIWFSVEL